MDRLLEKYEINEIAKKTHISPLSLERLFNYEFDKLDDIKIKGFIKILETEYPNTDFSELKEKLKDYSKKDEEDIIEIEEPKNNKKMYFIVLLIILLVIVVYFIQNNNNKISSFSKKEIIKKENIIEPNITNEISKKDEYIDSEEIENNKTITNEMAENSIEIEENKSEEKQASIDENVTIIPLEKVWFKVIYLDENKSKEYLTSHEVDLNGSKRIFIKFGHGMIKIAYNGKIIEPNTRKITRVIIENGEINITKKRVKEFK